MWLLIWLEKLQYVINREVLKISAWSLGKINKYEYLVGEQILFSNQTKEETKFTYSPLEKAFEKQVNASKPLNVSDKIN